jgi:drug/metabolite transporter (DMT)-like permease
MQKILPYLMMPVMASMLVIAQALWGTVIKHGNALQGTISNMAMNLITNYRMWLGAFIYIAATFVYFYMLSKLKFFSVQIGMTALTIVFSTVLSIILFNEQPNIINIIGATIILLGVGLVLYK